MFKMTCFTGRRWLATGALALSLPLAALAAPDGVGGPGMAPCREAAAVSLITGAAPVLP